MPYDCNVSEDAEGAEDFSDLFKFVAIELVGSLEVNYEKSSFLGITK